ncbi:hypothetical protein KP509_1Z166200 [Ceratopteris richardii]|nr:hypothetical protein KP509_1Z166200 [Ceratopteris richardii]
MECYLACYVGYPSNDILSAGVRTSAVTSEWAITELIRNPLCLRKLQKEMDSMKKDMITDDDISHMPYLQNVVKEVFDCMLLHHCWCLVCQ